MYQDIFYSLSEVTRFYSKEQKRGILVKPSQELGCQDNIQVLLSSNPFITNIQLEMQGCILLKASVNALCFAIENKSKTESIQIIDNFLKMIQGENFNPELLTENLKIFEKFKLALSRRTCLTLGALELKKTIETN